MRTRVAIALHGLPIALFVVLGASAAIVLGKGPGARPAPHGARASDFLSGLPEMPLAKERVVPSFAHSPGYVPREDPEAESEWTGRRDAGPIPDQLLFACPSAESLAAAVVDAVRRSDFVALDRLRLRYEEYATILWPEFPASRPASNVTAEDAWGNMLGNIHGGIHAALGDWGGTALEFRRLSAAGVLRYANFNLVDGVLLHAYDAAGREVILDFAPTFVERNGRWKVYSFKD